MQLCVIHGRSLGHIYSKKGVIKVQFLRFSFASVERLRRTYHALFGPKSALKVFLFYLILEVPALLGGEFDLSFFLFFLGLCGLFKRGFNTSVGRSINPSLNRFCFSGNALEAWAWFSQLNFKTGLLDCSQTLYILFIFFNWPIHLFATRILTVDQF